MSWDAWRLDAPTWAFIAWVGWFVAWESWALWSGQYLHTWTAHMRPLFTRQPLLWWLGVGAYLWFGVHVFVKPLEEWLVRTVGG